MQAKIIGSISILVLAIFTASPVLAQSKVTGWIDVNIGVATAAQTDRSTLATWTKTSETASFTANYLAPTGANFDFGGGVMFTPVFGIGLSFTGTAHQSTAPVSLTLPHPRYYNTPATDNSQTATLTYTEGGTNIQFMVAVPTKGNKFRLRFFGGPTYFQVKGSAVTNVEWLQTYVGTLNDVAITSLSTKELQKTAWGFHAGADVTYFFTRIVGIGAILRVNRGSVTISDADVLANDPMKVTLGGAQVAFGLRLRLGKVM